MINTGSRRNQRELLGRELETYFGRVPIGSAVRETSIGVFSRTASHACEAGTDGFLIIANTTFLDQFLVDLLFSPLRELQVINQMVINIHLVESADSLVGHWLTTLNMGGRNKKSRNLLSGWGSQRAGGGDLFRPELSQGYVDVLTKIVSRSVCRRRNRETYLTRSISLMSS